jgi:tetratricopeptide (TPR) repeat protein
MALRPHSHNTTHSLGSITAPWILLAALTIAQPLQAQTPSPIAQDPTSQLSPEQSKQLDDLLQEGRQALKDQQLDRALNLYQQAQTLDPRNAQIQSGIAYVQVQRGDLRAAADSFRQATALDPRNANYHIGLAYVLANSRDPDGAERAYRQALTLDRKKSDAYLGLGALYEKQKAYVDALRLYREWMAALPRAWQAHRAVGSVMIQQGKYREALQTLQQAVKLSPNTGEIYADIGIAQIGLGDLKAGSLSLERAARLSGTPQTYYKLGEVYRALNDDSRAYGAFKRAVDLNPNFSEARSRLGQILLEQRDFLQAAIIYRQLTDQNPQDGDAFFNLAIALRGRDRLSEAQAALEQARSIFERQGNKTRVQEAKELLKQLR